jgi:hypothetical protein
MIFETVGLVIGSIFSVYFCVSIKVYGYMFITVLSLLTYIILEVRTYRKNKLNDNENKEILEP